MMKKILLIIFLAGVALSAAAASVPTFTVTPAKVEAVLPPGGAKIVGLTIINNLGRPAEFTLAAEDLTAPNEPDSLVPYLDLPGAPVVLANGERRLVPIAIDLPAKAPVAGSLQGLVVVTLQPTTGVMAGARAVSRVGALFLIRVTGTEKFAGALTRFGLAGGALKWGDPPLDFYLNYQNRGNTYVNPYGIIEFKNLLTGETRGVGVAPWYVLPASARIFDVRVASLGGGLYRATLKLNRGYNNLVDTAAVNFIILPPAAAGLVSVILLILFGLYRVLKLKR